LTEILAKSLVPGTDGGRDNGKESGWVEGGKEIDLG